MFPCPTSARRDRKPQLSRPPEQFLKMVHNRADPNIAYFVSRTENNLHSTFGNFLSYGNAKRNPDQIRFFEFHSRSLIPIIQDHVQASCFVPFGNVLRRTS